MMIKGLERVIFQNKKAASCHRVMWASWTRKSQQSRGNPEEANSSENMENGVEIVHYAKGFGKIALETGQKVCGKRGRNWQH